VSNPITDAERVHTEEPATVQLCSSPARGLLLREGDTPARKIGQRAAVLRFGRPFVQAVIDQPGSWIMFDDDPRADGNERSLPAPQPITVAVRRIAAQA
jgi:hypothetical protein